MRSDMPWSQRIVVDPQFEIPVEVSTASASIDIHLGNRFNILHRRRDIEHDPLAPEADVATEEFFVSFGDKFPLHPGHLVLGTTLEWFRFPLDLMADVVGRSIWGRRGLLIASATAIQPGSAGTITLELSNLGEIPVSLTPGVSIGQLFFHMVEPPLRSDSKLTSFSGFLRPTLGHYKESEIEKFLLTV
jgi:dCTP deaminase